MAKKKSSDGRGLDIKAFLGEGSEFNGILTFEGTVRIDGRFQGEIMTKGTLIVGESAHLNADISAGGVVIKGKVFGDITASKRIDLLSGGQIRGDFRTPVVMVEEGALLDGTVQMTQHESIPGDLNVSDISSSTKSESLTL